MIELFKQVPLYRFLALCNEQEMEKKVLDCGSGGDTPPLSLFAHYGYVTAGIEMDFNQIHKANSYAQARDQQLQIRQGDMRSLPFGDAAFPFVYSYNSIFHMRKEEVKKAVSEMRRVLKPGGLMFVNFLTVSDFRVGDGNDLGQHQYEQMEDGDLVIHSYYESDEADPLFDGMAFVYKETRVVERIFEGRNIRQGFVDYIWRK